MTLMILSSEFQYAFSISLYFLLLSLSSIHKLLRERVREKKTNKTKTLKTHQSTDADTTSTIKKKHLDKTNPTASKKVTNYDWSESRELPKTQVSFTTFGWLIWLALSNVGNLN